MFYQFTKCCENCHNAIYDSVPYGIGSCSYLSGCKKEDKIDDAQYEAMEKGEIECPLWEAEGGVDYEL